MIGHRGQQAVEVGVPRHQVAPQSCAVYFTGDAGCGARLVVTLIHALKARGLKKGVASLCIVGGEATAIAIELV